MQIKALVGAGDRIALWAAPFAIAGLVANLVWPAVFRVGSGGAALAVGIVLLLAGVPLWLASVALIVVCVPKGQLITRGPFALVLHPLYTSVALLVLPGCGLVLGSWLGLAVGAILYASTRLFAPREERELAVRFPADYAAYRQGVLLPWL
jgi:protein-S-isoprenylcysteine O-methyltransferase Ste14